MESEKPASSDSDLVFMTCLMQLAVGARRMLRERQYVFPEVSDDLLKNFYPILSAFILDVQMREPNETDGKSSPRSTLYPKPCCVHMCIKGGGGVRGIRNQWQLLAKPRSLVVQLGGCLVAGCTDPGASCIHWKALFLA